ncbi:MAG: alpha/beta fold hydrolase [Geminicoccaceae bacterium]
MAIVTTSDGVGLSVVEKGGGRPLVLVPGWSQTARQFQAQIDGLADRYRVIAVDMRGHGQSAKPAHGYKIQRLAQDLKELLDTLDLRDAAVAGHSMGSSVLWCYWDLFGAHRIQDVVFVDQMPAITALPSWSAEERLVAGTIFDHATLPATIEALAGPDGVATTERMVGGMFTAAYPQDRLAEVIRLNLEMPRAHAAALLYNHSTQDWRDVIPTVGWRALVVGGRASFVSWQSQVWIHERIKGSRLELFEAEEGGQHFMFMENPSRFNALVRDFLG